MNVTPKPVLDLINEFSRLPGIGPKSASRLTFYLLRTGEAQAKALAAALDDLHQKVTFCSQCFNIAESDPCPICSDEHRDKGVICIVEEPLDVLAIERTGDFLGLYHVLHGAIAPVDGVGPEDLKIAELLARIENNQPREIIIATNPNLEGDATAIYIQRQLEGSSIEVTRLARGLPIGGDLEYADEMTLSRALAGRGKM